MAVTQFSDFFEMVFYRYIRHEIVPRLSLLYFALFLTSVQKRQPFRERFQASELSVMLSLQVLTYVHFAKGFIERSCQTILV